MNKRILIALVLSLYSTVSQANTCWDAAGKLFNIDPWWLFAIAAVESSFTPSISSTNTNQSVDLGLMQVNTIHLPTFQKMGISREQLQHNDCINIHAAAFLLRKSINRYGLNIDGIGGYHSGTPSRRQAYGARVIAKYKELTSRYHANGEVFSFERYKRIGTKNVHTAQMPVVKTSAPMQTYMPNTPVGQWNLRKNRP